jgi:HK97 family phage major capsid protein
MAIYNTGVVSKGSLFPAELVKDMFNNVKGHSSIARLSAQTPIAFNGNDVMVFAMDDEVNLLGENESKSAGSVTLTPVRMNPLKVEYGARVSDEFLYASEEKQIDMLAEFAEGYAKKVARGLDIMAMHGINPRTGTASSLIGTNSLDTNTDVTAVTPASPADPYADLEAAVTAIGDADVTGYALAKSFASALSNVTIGNNVPFAAFALGGNPGALNGVPADVNSTVTFGNSGIDAYVGDFANAFKWGYAKDIPLEVIPYGDPDNSGKDLKGYNQVYLRAETYIGWGILDGTAFARVG